MVIKCGTKKQHHYLLVKNFTFIPVYDLGVIKYDTCHSNIENVFIIKRQTEIIIMPSL